MPCDTRLKKNQTIQQRADEVRKAVAKVGAALASGIVKITIGPQGAIAFLGITEEDRDGVTDACIYRRIMATGSAIQKAKIEMAERLAGRAVDRKMVAHGHHSHDGGRTWHTH